MSISLDTMAVRRQFTRTFLGGMAFYTLAIFALSGWLGWQPPKSGAGLYFLSILPAFGVGIAVWAMLRYYSEEPDEFIRIVAVKVALTAFGLTMFTCTAWGLLVTYAHIWSLPLYFVFPLWAMMTGIARPIVNFYYR